VRATARTSVKKSATEGNMEEEEDDELLQRIRTRQAGRRTARG